MNRVSVAFVDDHPLFLAGVSSLFANQERFCVVATGGTATDAIEIAHGHHPAVMVMDLNMPGDAFAAIAQISRAFTTKIIAFTASTGIDCAVRALDAGASGYVLKGSTADELMAAIELVIRGETFINQGLATKVIQALRTAAVRPVQPESLKLSAREQQIVQLLLRGLTNRAIADRLAISEKTVKHYMTVLMQKMHARNRLEVVIAAQKMEGAHAEQGARQTFSYN
jgi:two-component system nitrate/nitrite response regulator NarL